MLYVIDRNVFVTAVLSSIKKWDEYDFIKEHLCFEDHPKLSEDSSKYTETDLVNAMDNAPEFRYAFATDQIVEVFQDIFEEVTFKRAVEAI